jgi:hypothetical protein
MTSTRVTTDTAKTIQAIHHLADVISDAASDVVAALDRLTAVAGQQPLLVDALRTPEGEN